MNVHNFFFFFKSLGNFSGPIKSIENPIKFKIECILHLLLDAYSIYLSPPPPLRKLTLRIFHQCRSIVFQLICRVVRFHFCQRKSIKKDIMSVKESCSELKLGLSSTEIQKHVCSILLFCKGLPKNSSPNKRYKEQKFVKKCRTWGSSLPFSSWLGHYSPKATPRLSNQQLNNDFKPEPNINIDAKI